MVKQDAIMSERDEQGTVADTGATAARAGDQALPEFSADSGSVKGAGEISFDLLLDVPVTLSVEIGRTRMPIKDLLALNQGSVVELGREVNDPLDLMVNGMLIARGEVVEQEGRFGLRLIDVVSPSERLKKLK